MPEPDDREPDRPEDVEAADDVGAAGDRTRARAARRGGRGAGRGGRDRGGGSGSAPKPERRRRRLVVAVVAAVVLVAGAVGVLLLDPFGEQLDPRSAAEGPEGTRTFEGLPRELPPSVLTEGVAEGGVGATVARAGAAWSAAASYQTTGDHEALGRGGDIALREDGFVLRQRAFDDRSMIVVYDHEDGTVLTMTYLSTGQADTVRITAVRTSS